MLLPTSEISVKRILFVSSFALNVLAFILWQLKDNKEAVQERQQTINEQKKIN